MAEGPVLHVVAPGVRGEWRAPMYALRHEVFVVGQDVPPDLERDEEDDSALHVVAVVDGAVLGTGRFVEVEPHDGLRTAKVGRMAVAEAARGTGLGAQVLGRLEAEAAAAGFGLVVLHAQRTAEGFYDRLGYHVAGEPFVEAGIDHIEMAKRL